MSNVEPKERYRWWTAPKTIIVVCCAVIAGAAALINNLKVIKNALGLGVTEVHIAHAFPSLHDKYLRLRISAPKSGPDVLRDCKFTVSVDGNQLEISQGGGPYTLPTGAFELKDTIGGTLSHWYLNPGDKGIISLNCLTFGSPTFEFTVP
jgi:hypothetical protein